ncbi:LOW QUALITY PROTEIN: bifunctional epoxide hydrolase 2 [Menidia menidia]
MSERRAVLFRFWGVVVPTRRAQVLQKLEELHELPRGFLTGWLPHSPALLQGETGVLRGSQMLPALEAELEERRAAFGGAGLPGGGAGLPARGAELPAGGAGLPGGWTARRLLDGLRDAMMDVQENVLQTAAGLRSQGVLTGVLATDWLEDGEGAGLAARLLCRLGGHFDLVLQSWCCGLRVPEPAMFHTALRQLGVAPGQALWVDVDEDGVRAAEGAGLKAALLGDMDAALRGFFPGETTAVGLRPPVPCFPDRVAHGYASIRPGVRTHYVEMGAGPPVLLCHGFPESWFSWRYQIPALASGGFRVLALDMKGYGESTAPPDTAEYSQQQLCQDLISFLDIMGLPQVTLVGHDWGGALVWNMAQFHPVRVRAVASLNTPLFPVDPSVPPSEKIKALPIFDYQLYFQKPGVAEAELEKDLERTFKIFFSRSSEAAGRPAVSTAGVCARGGLFAGLPEQIPRSSMLTEADLKYYVSQFKRSGFRGPLNWYRNSNADWKWMCSQSKGKLLMPALMVTAGKDPVLLPVMSQGMEQMIPNLSRAHIEECGHWTQMDQPAETNRILLSWLKEVHETNGGVTVAPKL